MHFVSSNIYRKAVRLAEREGVEPGQLAHHQPELRRGETYVPISLLFEVYELADRFLKPGFGLRQGTQLDSEDYGTLGLSWKTCWQAKEVLERIERFMVLVTDHGSVCLEESGGVTSVYLYRDAHRRGIAVSNEATLVMLVSVLREVTGQRIDPIKVHFKHDCGHADELKVFFRCPVSCGQKDNLIQFRSSDLAIPTLKADRSIQQFLLLRMDEEKRGIYSNADSFIRQLQELIVEALPSGIPGLQQVAEWLGMSPRTLKRRLAEKGHSFRSLVHQKQQELAEDLLRTTSQSIGEISFQTGFSEQSAFNRAFKRWTGKAPLDFRKNS
ncbi:AraC family transcriptional regulator ligand-binding domain-containing protein [Algoriphagus sp. H41]|uniref:AraC family transcriptional regulator ligand-binding domain-containing protein n=1 Tax=Algoriphagus oliviformis TaxID=2811231 RepID=A0ABS3CBX8_9BACT|nr:AraC family transcriptional regulator [Algoriphagus oliviformis]MBN7813661.1 AraC family transcriptional regulator ligand-binding domain-containing protein [Algoriphagus oliviformis]